MDPQYKPSFIPKAPLTDTSRVQNKKSSGVFNFIVAIIILGTLVSYGFVFLQTKKIEKVKNDYILRIEKARQEIGTSFVTEMVTLQKKITTARTLLQNHITVSPIFYALQETTVQRVQYTDFSYTRDSTELGGGMVVVKMTGIAPDYKTIALQINSFANNTLIKEPVISDIKNNDTEKTVTFTLEFKVDPRDVSYEKLFDEQKTSPLSFSQDIYELTYE